MALNTQAMTATFASFYAAVSLLKTPNYMRHTRSGVGLYCITTGGRKPPQSISNIEELLATVVAITPLLVG